MPGNLIDAKRALRRLFANLRRDDGGMALVEFAYSLPIMILLGFSGVEVANLAIANMRVSQIAMTIADNLSRAKQTVPLGLPQLREVDINDALLGANIQGGDSLHILEKGRIVVSSLQQNTSGKQTIKWQRCKGKLKNANSKYGVQGDTQPTGPTGFQGMGTGSTRVTAEANSAVIFAEVTYNYEPVFGKWLLGDLKLRREAAFYVRDDRNITGDTKNPDSVYNPAPTATKSACDVYTSTF